MSKLVPVKRPDINGHLVTRWVRPEDSHMPASSIPGPTVIPPASAHRVSRKLREGVQNQYIIIPKTIDFNFIEKRLFTLPAVTVDLIDGLLDTDNEDLYFHAYLISALNSAPSRKVMDDLVHVYASLEDDVRSDLSTYSAWTKDEFDGTEIVRCFLAGCERTPVPGFDYDYAGDTPLRMQGDYPAKALALYKVMSMLEEEFTGDHTEYEKGIATWISDPHLVALIVKHHDRVDEIMEVMRKRETVDPEAIAVVLSAGHQSLKDGAL